MRFTYRVYIELKFICELIAEIMVNFSRFLGMGPKRFSDYPKTLKGKVVIITGSNTGIGKACTRVLALLNAVSSI